MIMIVDDDPEMLLVMTAALERGGYHVNARSSPPTGSNCNACIRH